MWPRLPFRSAAEGAGALPPNPSSVASGLPPRSRTYSARIAASGASVLAPADTPSVSSTHCFVTSTSAGGSASYFSVAAWRARARVTSGAAPLESAPFRTVCIGVSMDCLSPLLHGSCDDDFISVQGEAVRMVLRHPLHEAHRV